MSSGFNQNNERFLASQAAMRALEAERAGRLDEAADGYRKAIEISPAMYLAYANLGSVYMRQEKPKEAEEMFRQALRINSQCAISNANLAMLLKKQNKFEEAIPHFRLATTQGVKKLELFIGFAECLVSRGNPSEAVDLLTPLAEVEKPHPFLVIRLSYCCFLAKRWIEAEKWCKKAIELEPQKATLHANLATVYLKRNRHTLAEKVLSKALELDPALGRAYDLMANVYGFHGKPEEALKLRQKAAELCPDVVDYQSNCLFNLHYIPDVDAQHIYLAHKRWGEIYFPPADSKPSFRNKPDPEKRLRIGYISPDFYEHPVACFLEPLLKAHDASQVESYAYSNVTMSDHVTQRLIPLFKAYRNVVGLSDAHVSEMIRNDEIDILIDLAGHGCNTRVRVLGLRSAPIQATYIGYPDTTGLTAVDYRFTDELADPPSREAFHTEALVRLPRCFLCYGPPNEASEVSPLPADSNGYVTFGSFNSRLKINNRLLDVWAEILRAVPDSRLLLKFPNADPDEIAIFPEKWFTPRGIDPWRIQMVKAVPSRADHLGHYGRMDIMLDTFPYNGTTTTCEAMWMGVPAVTWAGEHHMSRVGVSLLTAAGLPGLVAVKREEYIAKAVALAGDCRRLSDIRAHLRSLLARGPLCDAKALAKVLETFYRQMWRKWCEREKAE